MAKDPAMLWYWNDWFSGTILLSRFLKGCYMDLLHAEFNNGRLSLEEIKTCLGSDFGQSWPTLQKKFKQDETGLFFNEKLEQEQNKRKAFSESRRQNVLKKPPKPTYVDTSVQHMYQHMENENENNVLGNNKNSENQKFWTEIKNEFFNCYWWVEKFCRDKKVSPDEMKRQMTAFMVDTELLNEVKTLSELQSHFLHSFNKGKYKKKDEQADKNQDKFQTEYERKMKEHNQRLGRA